MANRCKVERVERAPVFTGEGKTFEKPAERFAFRPICRSNAAEIFCRMELDVLGTIHLSQLGVEHLDALEQLESLCLGAWTRDGLEVELTRAPRDLANPDRPSSFVFGAWSDNSPPALIGFAALWSIGEEAHIITLGVHPDWRRQRIGRQLVERLLLVAAEQQLGWATLEVRASNQGAIALYESLGFKSVGRRKRYYNNPEDDGLILWKRLEDNL